MYHIRIELHRTAYRHKVCSAIELMIIDAFYKANKVFKFDKKIEDIEEYCYLNDSIKEDIINFKLTINDFDDETSNDLKEAQLILNRIETRKLYKYINHTILENSQEIVDEAKIRDEVIL